MFAYERCPLAGVQLLFCLRIECNADIRQHCINVKICRFTVLMQCLSGTGCRSDQNKNSYDIPTFCMENSEKPTEP